MLLVVVTILKAVLATPLSPRDKTTFDPEEGLRESRLEEELEEEEEEEEGREGEMGERSDKLFEDTKAKLLVKALGVITLTGGELTSVGVNKLTLPPTIGGEGVATVCTRGGGGGREDLVCSLSMLSEESEELSLSLELLEELELELGETIFIFLRAATVLG